jgi:two-component system, NtrC family, sensor kinase
MEQVIKQVIQGVSNSFGNDFFNKITLHLHNITQSDYTFIAKIDKDKYSANTISLVAKGNLAENFEYSLSYTPCANVADNSICCYPEDVTGLFPQDQLLIDMNIEAYLGVPVKDKDGQVMGIIVALYENPIQNEKTTTSLFEIFSGRISAEILQLEYESHLRELNQNQSSLIEEKTKELEYAQAKLIESEKLNALGTLVTGIAHEVNTPLGISITAESILSTEFIQLKEHIDNETLSVLHMQNYCSKTEKTLDLLNQNLVRAKNLVDNFKKTSADQHSLDIEKINIKDYYRSVIQTLVPAMKDKGIEFELNCKEEFIVNTYPGMHGQVITNLIVNSIKHAFFSTDNNKISFSIYKVENEYIVDYRDNGVGINEEAQQHVFEPFYTTARDIGGTGLGMSIVYNLLNQNLNGSIQIMPSPKGAHFEYRFKETLF